MVDLTINGVSQSQTLDGTHDYDSVSITNGGILNVTPYNGTGTTGTLILNVSGNVYVDSASKINADICGYSGAASSCNGLGGMPAGNGGGTAGSGGCGSSFNGGGGGGSYGTVGGNGGCSSQYYNGGCAGGGAGGIIRGTTTGQDIGMGSGSGGGGGAQECTYCGISVGGAGSPGGGSITINANTMNIFGTITANGGVGGWGRTVVGSSGAGSGGGGGGASGGGIKLSAATIDVSNSTIRANGGSGGGGGSGAVAGGTGGGGRIKIFGETITTTGATITAGTIYSEIVVTTGSASFTSSPSGARIWIDDIDQNVNTPSTISGLTPLPASHTYKLVSGIYTATGTFTVTTGMTTNVSITIDVTAIDIVPSTNTCVGTCQVTITTTWKNNGNTDITFRPAIKIDTDLVQAATDITIAAGSNSNPIAIVTPTLSIGTHNICPLPN